MQVTHWITFYFTFWMQVTHWITFNFTFLMQVTHWITFSFTFLMQVTHWITFSFTFWMQVTHCIQLHYRYGDFTSTFKVDYLNLADVPQHTTAWVQSKEPIELLITLQV
jgi:hypothetical protein